MKKKVIAYLHTHWDREWYREFEVFRLRLVRVFDNVLSLLRQNKIPSFYFDGQVSALLDYLEFRPEKEPLVRDLIKRKKLFIGPFYTLVDEFLTDRNCFEKNLELGLKISRDFGCTDFIGYLADTFGHSQNVPLILKEFGIDKCVVWRGCGDLPSEFIFNGLNTVNLVRGYFMDIFSSNLSVSEKADWLKKNLDMIAEKSGDTLLLPIGADHLGVEKDIADQINEVNKLLDDYEIKLSSPFEYFELVKDNFKTEWNDELRDNSKTFILPGSYSARTKIKQYNVTACYKLNIVDKIQQQFDNKYSSAIEYAYKLLLKNQAHDGICGCSTDEVHQENIIRYKKIIQIADTILKEIKFLYPKKYEELVTAYCQKYCKVMKFDGDCIPEDCQPVSERLGFSDKILYDTQRIPVTEDIAPIYRYIKPITFDDNDGSPISVLESVCKVEDNKIKLINGVTIDFVRYNDAGDTYNFGAVEDDVAEVADIKSSKIVTDGDLRAGMVIKTSFFDVNAYIDRGSNLLRFKINWDNTLTNKLWQVRFNLLEPVTTTYSEDMNTVITRHFDPDYNIREHLPKSKDIEVKTNTAPMQRYVGAQGFGVITKGLTEYEVYKNTLSITLLRSVGIISNPKNPSRTTPAGPPIEVPEAQQIGHNIAEFAVGFFGPTLFNNYIEEFFSQKM